MAHNNAASGIGAIGEFKGGASAAGPVATAVGGIFPAGACFQAGYIDSGVISNSIGRANAGVAGQGQAGGSCSSSVDGERLHIAIDAAVSSDQAANLGGSPTISCINRTLPEAENVSRIK